VSQGVAKDLDIRTAVEQVCGNRGALQLLVDLLTSKYVFLSTPVFVMKLWKTAI
jgi:hypothetical protein